MARCVNTSSMDSFHPGELEWENGHAFCPRCMRYKRAIAKRMHPAGKAVAPNLPPLDPYRCYHHNRDDKLSCPECQQNYEDTHTVSGVEVYFND